MTVRPVSTGAGEYELSDKQLFTDYEKELLTRVVTMAEKEGKTVDLLVVPGVDPFDAMVQTAAKLKASRLVTGVSREDGFRGTGPPHRAGLGETAGAAASVLARDHHPGPARRCTSIWVRIRRACGRRIWTARTICGCVTGELRLADPSSRRGRRGAAAAAGTWKASAAAKCSTTWAKIFRNRAGRRRPALLAGYLEGADETAAAETVRSRFRRGRRPVGVLQRVGRHGMLELGQRRIVDIFVAADVVGFGHAAGVDFGQRTGGEAGGSAVDVAVLRRRVRWARTSPARRSSAGRAPVFWRRRRRAARCSALARLSTISTALPG